MLLSLSLSFTLTTPSTSSSPSHCPGTLLCQSYRGSEWALESIDASEITLGGFRLPLLLCGCSLQQLLHPRHPPSPTAASHQFLNSFPHSSSSLTPTWPRLPRHHQSFTLYKAHPLRSPSTVDLIPQLSWRLSCGRISLSPKPQSGA